MDYIIYKGWVFVLLAGINSTVGNLLLKKSTEVESIFNGFFISINLWFVSGLFFYGLNVVLFAKALETLDVGAAYPVLASISFLLLAVASLIMLGEKLALSQYIGIIVVLFGIYLLAIK